MAIYYNLGGVQGQITKEDLGIDELAADIELSMDSSYNLTVSLKNEDGETIGDGDTVDLPLESMVVGGSYDDGVLTLTLKNSQTIDIPISDIVDGLVSESRTIAGLPLTSDIASSALQNALSVPSGGAEEKGFFAEADMDENLMITFRNKTVSEVYDEIADAWESSRNVKILFHAPTDTPGETVDISGEVFVRDEDGYFSISALIKYQLLTIFFSRDVISVSGVVNVLNSEDMSFDIPQTIEDDETEEKVPTVQAALDHFQQKITSSNKLPYANISGTPTNLVTGYNNTAYTMRPITQADYNALGTKDSHTLYLITG